MKKFNFIAILSLIIVWSSVISSQFVQAATYKTNQDCTGYVATGDPMANGEWPIIGYVAVHPTTSDGNTPVIPFGTYLYIDSIKSQNGTWQSSWNSPGGVLTFLRVGDIGDKVFDRGLSTYWVDLYYGDHSTDAVNWGKGAINYHYN